MQTRTVELAAIKETTEDYEEAERKIRDAFKREIYLPLLRLLGEKHSVLKNAMNPLLDAIQKGKVYFSNDSFAGNFSASISKELRSLGAKWDRTRGVFKISQKDLPQDVLFAISSSEHRFLDQLDAIDKKLMQISPAEIAGKINLTDSFDRSLWKVESSFQKSVKNITVAPKLTLYQRKRIASEWQNNMELYITDFVQKETEELRRNVKASVFTGNRYESLVGKIKESYGVSERKAKFLARQETMLLMTKFKQTRYAEAGVMEYKWRAVKGTPAHPTRPAHAALSARSDKGEIFRWDNPPLLAEDGKYKNPAQDYNCRCTAIPVVRFKK